MTRSSSNHAVQVPLRTGAIDDFDFLAGSWAIQNRTLRVDLDASETWDEYPATSRMTIYLGGVLNVEEYQFPTKGYSAVALRIFDLEKSKWSIYWIESRAGKLLPPVVGGFDGDQGEFFGEDDLAGQPALFRFIWARVGTDRARWEQAYTRDGRTWKVNWVMELTRVGQPDQGRAPGVGFTTGSSVKALRPTNRRAREVSSGT